MTAQNQMYTQFCIPIINNGNNSEPKNRRVRFTVEQDLLIKKYVANNINPDWAEIAKLIPGKTGKQCRERYNNFLSPTVNKEAWTPEDDLRLLHSFHYFGTSWASIAPFFPGRTNNDIKNRYYGHLRNKELDVFLAAITYNRDLQSKFPVLMK